MVNRSFDKLHVYEMSLIFDSTNLLGSSQKVSTLQSFLESCLTLEKDPDALEEITSLLYRHEGGRRDHPMNSLQKEENGRRDEDEHSD